MKKIISTILIVSMSLILFASCGKDENTNNDSNTNPPITTPDETPKPDVSPDVKPDVPNNNNSSDNNPSDNTFKNPIKYYYPGSEKEGIFYIESNDTLEKIGTDKAAKYFETKFKNTNNNTLAPVIPASTKVNSVKFDKETSIATIDISEVFPITHNMGTGEEAPRLQCIANTLGSAYGCKKIVITVNGAPFSSSLYEITPKDPLTVDTKETIKVK